jgi:hypothetical protein
LHFDLPNVLRSPERTVSGSGGSILVFREK